MSAVILKTYKHLSMIALAFALAIPVSAWAISLDEAKAKGLVGELNNGYLGSVLVNPDNDVKKLIVDINQKRKAAYIQKAKEAGVTLQIMELRVGERLINRAEKGEYYSDGKGSWQKK